MEQTKQKLRFAALCRVSTEQQKKGESLAVQKLKIEQAVEWLGGKVVSWFGGQEHGTEGYEKTEVDRLLADASKGRFNCFVCSHADRWSRDNVKSHEGLEILSKAKVRFFILTTEYDLSNAEHLLCLEMFSAFGAFQSRHQKSRSIDSRIQKAKRGCASSGRIPFGRTYDKTTEKWGIDADKQAIVKDAATRYLNGEGLRDIADEYHLDHGGLWAILMRRCGDEWTQKFKQNGEQIVVKTKVPRLLPDDTITKLRAKAEANKTYSHGSITHNYLLSRMIFCGHCGYALQGQTSFEKYRYYSHHYDKHKGKQCDRPKKTGMVRAGDIEDLCCRYLFDMFGNPEAVEKAIQKAIPDLAKVKTDRKRLLTVEQELTRISKGRDRIIHLVGKDAITNEDAEKELRNLNSRDEHLKDEQSRLCESLQYQPDVHQIKMMSEKVTKRYRHTFNKLVAEKRHIAHDYDGMSYNEKRKLVELVFSGKTPNDRRMGIYITWTDKGWHFDLHGHLIDEQGLLPLSDSMKEAYFSEAGGTGKFCGSLAEH